MDNGIEFKCIIYVSIINLESCFQVDTVDTEVYCETKQVFESNIL